jgi:regulator of chromosome condensation
LARVSATEEGEDGVDVVDVAVGDHHIAALSEDGRVFTVGEGTNGQLGTGTVEFAEEWVECEFEGLEQHGRPVGVHCGPRNTFVLAAQRRGSDDEEEDSKASK